MGVISRPTHHSCPNPRESVTQGVSLEGTDLRAILESYLPCLGPESPDSLCHSFGGNGEWGPNSFEAWFLSLYFSPADKVIHSLLWLPMVLQGSPSLHRLGLMLFFVRIIRECQSWKGPQPSSSPAIPMRMGTRINCILRGDSESVGLVWV